MGRFLLILFFFLFTWQYSLCSGFNLPEKEDTLKRKSIFVSVAGGGIYTSVFFYRNYQDVIVFTPGYTGRLMFQYNSLLRFSVNYTKLNEVEIFPVWRNVKNTFIDVEAHLLTHFKIKAITLYLIGGGYAQYWDGFYTGIQDRNGWRFFIQPNTNFKRTYYGVTFGYGVEAKIIGPFSIFAEFRLRAGKTEISRFGLNDNLYYGGLKLNLFGSPHTQHHHRSILKFHDKYHWF